MFKFLMAVFLAVTFSTPAKSQTVTIYTGAGAGGGYSVYARVFGKYMSNHLEGNPTVRLNNMPGGAGVKAANFVYNVAPKNCTALLQPHKELSLLQLLKPKGMKFDMGKFRWVGNKASLNSVLVIFSKKAKTIDDLKQKQIILGATGKTSGTYIWPTVMNSLIGTKFKIVTGYRGGRDMVKAMEGGETDGWDGGSTQSWGFLRPKWIESGKAIMLIQSGLTVDPKIPNIPMLLDLVKPEDKKLVELLTIGAIARMLALPPGVSEKCVSKMRTAFDKTMKDPAFIAEAEKRGMPLNYISGEELEALVAKILKTPKETVNRAKSILRY